MAAGSGSATPARSAELPRRHDVTPPRRVQLVGTSRQPFLVAAVVLCLYAAWATSVAAGGDPIRLANVGHRFLELGAGTSPVIDSLEPTSEIGYDGQFAAYIALDPAGASDYLDRPAYRYARVAYPLVVRVLSLGEPAAVGWALLLVNVAAAALLTFSAAAFLSRFGVSAWYALIIGLSPGLAAGVLRDLTEPLAYALAATGMLLLADRPSRKRVLAASLVFAVAGLTRETALLFALASAAGLAFGLTELGRKGQGRPKSAALVLSVSLLPALALRTALPWFLEDGGGDPVGQPFTMVPLQGLFGREFGVAEQTELLSVVVPGCLAFLVAALLIRRVTATLLALALNALVLVVFLASEGYDHLLGALRITLGVPLALVLCLVAVRSPRSRLALALGATALWSLAWLHLRIYMFDV